MPIKRIFSKIYILIESILKHIFIISYIDMFLLLQNILDNKIPIIWIGTNGKSSPFVKPNILYIM
jgi:hypothetical protein